MSDGPRYRGADWLFEVVVCPDCIAQIHADSEGVYICWEHGKITEGVTVEVTHSPLSILEQLGQVSVQTQVPGE